MQGSNSIISFSYDNSPLLLIFLRYSITTSKKGESIKLWSSVYSIFKANIKLTSENESSKGLVLKSSVCITLNSVFNIM